MTSERVGVLAQKSSFEHTGTGSAVEIEADEGGEFESEIEKGGEVELEQFWIQKSLRSGQTLNSVTLLYPLV